MRTLALLIVLVVGACLHMNRAENAPAGPPPSAEAVEGTIRIEGTSLYADVITRGLVGGYDILIDQTVVGTAGEQHRSQRRCSGTSVHVCSTLRADNSGGTGLTTLESQGVDLGANAAAGVYTISWSAGGVTLGRALVEVVRVPTVGGRTALAVVPTRPVLHAGRMELVAWLPIDARMRGMHAVQLVFFRNGEFFATNTNNLNGAYAYVSYNGTELNLDTPAFQMIPFRIPPPTERGDFEVVALLDAHFALASWKMTVDAKGWTGEGTTMFDEQRDTAAWNFVGTVRSAPATRQRIVAARTSAARERAQRPDPITREAVACALATQPKAKVLLEEYAQALKSDDESGSMYAGVRKSSMRRADVKAIVNHGRVANEAERAAVDISVGRTVTLGDRHEVLERKINSLGQNEKPGCLSRILGPLGAFVAR